MARMGNPRRKDITGSSKDTTDQDSNRDIMDMGNQFMGSRYRQMGITKVEAVAKREY